MSPRYEDTRGTVRYTHEIGLGAEVKKPLASEQRRALNAITDSDRETRGFAHGAGVVVFDEYAWGVRVTPDFEAELAQNSKFHRKTLRSRAILFTKDFNHYHSPGCSKFVKWSSGFETAAFEFYFEALQAHNRFLRLLSADNSYRENREWYELIKAKHPSLCPCVWNGYGWDNCDWDHSQDNGAKRPLFRVIKVREKRTHSGLEEPPTKRRRLARTGRGIRREAERGDAERLAELRDTTYGDEQVPREDEGNEDEQFEENFLAIMEAEHRAILVQNQMQAETQAAEDEDLSAQQNMELRLRGGRIALPRDDEEYLIELEEFRMEFEAREEIEGDLAAEAQLQNEVRQTTVDLVTALPTTAPRLIVHLPVASQTTMHLRGGMDDEVSDMGEETDDSRFLGVEFDDANNDEDFDRMYDEGIDITEHGRMEDEGIEMEDFFGDASDGEFNDEGIEMEDIFGDASDDESNDEESSEIDPKYYRMTYRALTFEVDYKAQRLMQAIQQNWHPHDIEKLTKEYNKYYMLKHSLFTANGERRNALGDRSWASTNSEVQNERLRQVTSFRRENDSTWMVQNFGPRRQLGTDGGKENQR